LIQTLTLVNPNHWSKRFDTAPQALARAAWKSDWGSAVMTGWSRAALLHDVKEWMVALWDAWLTPEPAGDPQAEPARRDLLIALLQRMPRDEAEARVMMALRDPAVAQHVDLEAALDGFEGPWSDALGSCTLEAIETLVRTPAASSSLPLATQLAGLLRAAGPSLPASLLDRAIALGSQEAVTAANRVTREFDVFDQQLRLRQRLYQEIGT
jgi:hypothetical protein